MRRKYRKGKYEDHNKYFTCPKCGAILNIERNKPADRMSTTVTDLYLETYPYDTHSTVIVLDCLDWIGSVIGSSDIFYASRNVKNNTGCWFCGNVNI